MPNQFFSPEGDLENYFVTEYWLIDQYVGDTLWIWGRNSAGQLGLNILSSGTFDYRSTPVTTFAGGANWKQISMSKFALETQGGASQSFSGAIKIDGTLWTWGFNSSGQLGNNTTTGPICTPITTFAGGINWKQVACGKDHMAAIKTDGTLWTWGSHFFGQLGIGGSGGTRQTPVQTSSGGTNWKQVACGGYFTSAIKTDGTLWTWGYNSTAQLGNNNTTNSGSPAETFVGGTNWKQVDCGSAHIAAIKTDGTLWTWGWNSSGQLGDNTLTNKCTPVTTFAGGTNWKQVSCGNRTTAALKNDRTLWTWGDNVYGQAGDNSNNSFKCTPVTTFSGGTNWKQVSNGYFHMAAIKTDGTLWVWGRNYFVNLGNNTGDISKTPITTFLGGTNWKQCFSSIANTAAVTSGTDPTFFIS